MTVQKVLKRRFILTGIMAVVDGIVQILYLSHANKEAIHRVLAPFEIFSGILFLWIAYFGFEQFTNVMRLKQDDLVSDKFLQHLKIMAIIRGLKHLIPFLMILFFTEWYVGLFFVASFFAATPLFFDICISLGYSYFKHRFATDIKVYHSELLGGNNGKT